MRRIFAHIPVLLAFLAGIALYVPSLKYERTFDDDFHTTLYPAEETRSFVQVWSEPYWWSVGYGGLYRPLVSTAFWIENKTGAPLPVRHGLNVLLHGLVSALVVLLARRLGLRPWVAGATGLLFAVHPVHVEAVSGLVGRAELLAAGLVLLALLLHDRAAPKRANPGGSRRPVPVWLWAGVLSFLAAGAKESAWPLPLYALALDLARRRSPRLMRSAYVGYVAGLAGHLLLRRAVLGGWLNQAGFTVSAFDNPLVALHGADRLLGSLRVLGMNLAHLVYPLALLPDYSGSHLRLHGSALDPALWAGLCLPLGSAALAVWGWRWARLHRPGNAALLVGGAWLLVSSLLFMNLFFMLGTALADRLLYWPSVAWVLVVGGFGERFLSPAGRLWRHVLAGVLAAGLGAGYTVTAAAYLPSWSSNLTLFERAARVAPGVARTWFNLGQALRSAGRNEEALEPIRKARTMEPSWARAWAEEADVLIALGRLDEAKEQLEEARRLDPRDVAIVVNEGVGLARAGDHRGAAAKYREALARDPRHPEALFNLGIAENLLGNYEEAARVWRRYLVVRYGDAAVKNDLAWLLATRLGRVEEAERLAREALRANPEDPRRLDTLAEVLFREGRREDALGFARQAAARDTASYFRDQIRRFEVEPVPPEDAGRGR